MRRAAILSFSERGGALAERLADGLRGEWQVELRAPRGNLAAVTAELFSTVDALIFVGACGIAVRAVAPLVAGKTRDPAVVVVDERGLHAISLLSGHIGGANALALRVAGITGGEAVITTATDVNGRFSVDAWAARQGLRISDMRLAKRFSAEILRRDLPLWSEFPIAGDLPDGIFLAEWKDCADATAPVNDCASSRMNPPANREAERTRDACRREAAKACADVNSRCCCDIGAAITCRAVRPFGDTLRLIPPVLHLGIGCKRGASAERIAEAVRAALDEAGLLPEAVAGAASIDVKRDEPGLREFCASMGIPIAFYSAEELRAQPGEFTASEFVERTVGVDNVCERAAMRAAGSGAKLLVPKRGANGVTVAIARAEWRVCFP